MALLAENLGEPGFRELILRAADLDRGEALAFVLLRDRAGRRPPRGAREGALADAVDLRAPGHDALFFDAAGHGPPLPAGDAAAPRVVPEGSRRTRARPTG